MSTGDSLAPITTVAARHAKLGRATEPVSRAQLLGVLRDLAPTGYLASTLPPPYGTSRPALEFSEMVETLTPYLPFLGGHSVQRYLAEFGSEKQRERWLPELLAGHAIGAIAITEAGTGGDVRSTATTAVERGGGWVLRGAKTWVTHGPVADLFVVTARTAERLTRFLVPAGVEGISSRAFSTSGLRYLTFGEIVLDDVHVRADAVLGEVGHGLSGTVSAFPTARALAALQACALASAALDETLGRLAETTRFGTPLVAKQGVQLELSSCWGRVQAARALAREAIRSAVAGEPVARRQAAAAKALATDTAADVCASLLRLLGSSALHPGEPVVRRLEDVRMLGVADAPPILNQLIVARDLTGRATF